jgi:4-amino-4-deoxy-L-arabinose transferase-like glycosyltransferase
MSRAVRGPVSSAINSASREPFRALRSGYLWLALALCTALAYLWGLDGLNIPKFGDEMVYTHIARKTAESGHWLPLQSEYGHMRNTKPPLLFWQAMVAGQWGADWRMGALRLPSVIYTWATALIAALLAARLWRQRLDKSAADSGMTGERSRMTPLMAGAITACTFLLFFSTVRYNRTYLTSGPETFWMFFVMFVVAWSPARALGSRLCFPLAAGAAIGLACLYKSFVLVVPVGFAMLLCHFWRLEQGAARVQPHSAAPRLTLGMLSATALKLIISTTLALAIFSLWFALDPQPGEIWREFIVGENVGRISGGPGYLSIAFGADSGIWIILVACFSNGGLLLPVIVGAAIAALQAAWRGESASPGEKVLWLWILALTLFFLVPSQRTSRYLIPAMPAVAILVALHWRQIHRGWFLVTALLAASVVALMGLVSWGGIRATGDTDLYSPIFWVLLALMLAIALVAFMVPRLTPLCSLTAGLGAMLAMTGVYMPFNGPAGQFEPQAIKALKNQTVSVAYQFTGQSERYWFLLPGVKMLDLQTAQTRTPADLDKLPANIRYAIVQDTAACPSCKVIASRWEPGNQPGRSTADAILRPDTYWFGREYVIERNSP